MRKIHKLIPAVALALAGAKAAHAQVLYEPFDYLPTNTSGTPVDTTAAAPENELVSPNEYKHYSTNGTYWARRQNVSTNTFNSPSILAGNTNPTMLGTTILPTARGASLRLFTTSTGRTPSLGLGEYVTSGKLYWSMAVKVNALPSSTSGAFVAGFNSFSMPGNALTTLNAGMRIRLDLTDNTKWNIGLTEYTGNVVWDARKFAVGDVPFVVARLNIDPVSNPSGNPGTDTMNMWINPTANFGVDESSVPAPDLTLAANNDLVDSLTPAGAAHASFFVRGVAGTGPPIFDELRIDSTWAGVTPDGKLQYTWNDAGGGTWSDNTKWNDYAGAVAVAAPGGTGQVANFNNNIASGSTITVDGDKNIDTLNFSNKGSLTVTGGKLIVDTNASAGQIVAYKGSHTIASAIELGDNLAIKVQGSSYSGTAGSPDPAAQLTLTGPVTGAGKTLSKYGQGTLVLGASDIIADDVKLAVRSGPLDLGANNDTVASVSLGVGHPNPATAINSTPDLATGSIIGTGTLTSSSWDLQSGTISASMAGSGVVKNNQATVTLSGNNTYTGDTTVTGGVLILAGTNSNSVRAVVQAPISASNGTQSTLQISADSNMGAVPGSPMADAINLGNGARLRFSDNMVLNANRGITMTSTSPGLIDVTSAKTAEVAGVISGAGGLTKTGLGTLVVSGANTYAGATNVVSGGSTGSILRIGADNALPTGTTLGLNTLNATGAAVFDLGGFNQQVANVINNGGGGTALPTITNSAVGLGTLTIANTGATNLAIPMSGNMALAKDAGGTLTISGANTYTGDTIVRSGVVSVGASNNLGAATNGIQLAGGTLRNTAAITSTRNVSVAAAGGSLDATADLSVGNIAGEGALTKSSPGTLIANHVRTDSLLIDGGNVKIAPSGGVAAGVSRINTISIGDNKLDLGDNKLMTTTSAGTVDAGTYSGIQGQVQRAYDFGAWDQPGLTTSMPDAVAGLTTIGVATGEQVRGLGPTDTDTFAGQTINGATTIAMYTYAGDANLDGTIDGGDYGIIDNFVQVPGADSYANGDFNYDGVIDGGDYGIIDNNIQAQGAPFPTSGSATSGLSAVTAVPEPAAAISLLGLGAAGLMGRRRRRCN